MTETTPPRHDARAAARVVNRLGRAPEAPWLHREVARRMAERLPLLRQAPGEWLDWWGFLGGGAEAVTAVWPDAVRHVAEPNALLVERSRAAIGGSWWSRARAAQARRRVVRVDELAPAAAPMVWANMMLHWAGSEPATIARWHRALAADGWLMFSTFGPQTLHELRELYAAAGWPPPHAPFTDMHDLGDLLGRGGFADAVMDQQTLRLSWSTPQAALAELRALGGNTLWTRPVGLRTPRWRERLCAALAARADGAGRIALSFEIVFGHAWRSGPRDKRPGEATIDTSALRTMRRRGIDTATQSARIAL